MQKAAQELGVNMDATSARAGRRDASWRRQRIALWDTPTGSMPSGWTRFLLERFEFPFTIVCGAGFDDTALRVEVRRHRPAVGRGASCRRRRRSWRWWWRWRRRRRAGRGSARQPSSDPDLRSLCEVTTGTGTGATAEANVRKFVEAGGVVIAAGSSARIDRRRRCELPVSDYLVERQPGQPDRALEQRQVLRPGLDPARRGRHDGAVGAAGAEDHIDVFFNNSPVFRLAPNAAARGVRPVMWFDSATPLRSGWAWGQNYLEGGTTAFEATLGEGKVYAFGPEITFRAQPHGTFKFLFNGIYQASRKGAVPTTTASGRQF